MIWPFDLLFYTRGGIKWASFPTVRFTMPSRPIPAYTDNQAKNHKVATFQAARFTMAPCLTFVRNFVQGGRWRPQRAPIRRDASASGWSQGVSNRQRAGLRPVSMSRKTAPILGRPRIRTVSTSLKTAPRWDASASGPSQRISKRHPTGSPNTSGRSQRISNRHQTWTPTHPTHLNEPQNDNTMGHQRIRPVSTSHRSMPHWDAGPLRAPIRSTL
jgi:hypothetical protein